MLYAATVSRNPSNPFRTTFRVTNKYVARPVAFALKERRPRRDDSRRVFGIQIPMRRTKGSSDNYDLKNAATKGVTRRQT